MNARTPNLRRLALLLAGLAMFGPFSIDTIFPAFPAMGVDLGADKVAMQQTISAYLVAYALMSVVHGPLSDALGRRRVILGGLEQNVARFHETLEGILGNGLDSYENNCCMGTNFVKLGSL